MYVRCTRKSCRTYRLVRVFGLGCSSEHQPTPPAPTAQVIAGDIHAQPGEKGAEALAVDHHVEPPVGDEKHLVREVRHL